MTVAGRAEWAAGRRPDQPTARFCQLIVGSTAPQARQRLMFARYETALASLLAQETGTAAGSVEPFVVAVALIAVLRAASSGGVAGRADQNAARTSP